ncbi:MAG TPA: type I DNA topoisomerase [Firmicutes bacterium]|nr:type I DNA topoisomerase [Bacillota bacterium]
MSYLVIVESPSKARTISRFLGRNYQVKASMGHLIDLPKSKLGIDLEQDFAPDYILIRGKGKILKELKQAQKKSKKVFLAADPDREGEAICWHLGQALNVDQDEDCRVEFNEITKEAVLEAFKNPRPIDRHRVDAQQARRILDRLVGYQISPLLWRKVRSGLSAGRVQSVAVRLICDREQEIENFIEEEYWTLEALLGTDEPGSEFKALLAEYRNEKLELKNQDQAEEVVKAVQEALFKVDQVKKGRRLRRPLPPFITSSLQQEASSKLGFTGQKTMFVAQQLYEGIKLGSGEQVGLVTYIRTDSVRVSEQAQSEVRRLIKEKFGEKYLPSKAPKYRSRKGAQEAHEAIRPTSAFREPATLQPYLTGDQFRLYQLIWNRFTASQMAEARFDRVSVRISAGDYLFRATGSSLRFPGFLALLQETGKEEPKELPPLKEGQILNLLELQPEQHFTQPPPRYSEASLIKALEDKGIGRPSTYAPIIGTILARGYVNRKNKVFIPAELGIIVVGLMKEYFPEIIDVDFTAQMERQLDQIEAGSLDRVKVLSEFYQPFEQRLKVADKEIIKVELTPEESTETCPQCGKILVYKHGRFGRFLACPGFPDCRYTKNINREIGVSCPLDGGQLVERRSKKGRIFYGCNNYPRCRFAVWDKPLPEKCPLCGGLVVKSSSRKNPVKRCSEKGCSYSEPLTSETTRKS